MQLSRYFVHRSILTSNRIYFTPGEKTDIYIYEIKICLKIWIFCDSSEVEAQIKNTFFQMIFF